MFDLEDFGETLLKLKDTSRQIKADAIEINEKLAQTSQLVEQQKKDAAAWLDKVLKQIDTKAHLVYGDMLSWQAISMLCAGVLVGVLAGVFGCKLIASPPPAGGIMTASEQELVATAGRLAVAIDEAKTAKEKADESSASAVKLLLDSGASQDMASFLVTHAADIEVRHYPDHDALIVLNPEKAALKFSGCFGKYCILAFPSSKDAPQAKSKDGKLQRRK